MESNIKNIKSLVFYEDQLFFLHSQDSSGNIKHKVLSLWNCKINGEVCEDPKQFPILFQDSTLIKAPVHNVKNLVENSCKINNGNCSHLCLLTSDKSRSCACRTGYQLNLDSQTCKPVSDIILYIESNYIKGIPLNSRKSTTFKDVIVPTRLSPGSFYSGLNYNYDEQNDHFYFHGSGAIKVMSILNESKTKILINGVPISYSFVFDKISKNFYYVDDINDNLKVAHLKRKKVFKKNLLPGHNIEHYSVNPNKGQIFLIIKNAGLYTVNTDGSNLKNLSSDYLQYKDLKGSAWDYDENTVYFFDESNVFSKNFDDLNSELQRFDMLVKNPKSISVYKENVYLSNSSGIWSMDKKNGKNIKQIFRNTGKKIISDITLLSTTVSSNEDDPFKIIPECVRNNGVFLSAAIFSDDVDNECERNNGNCEHFCFSKPHKTCGCMDGYQVQTNGSCKKVK